MLQEDFHFRMRVSWFVCIPSKAQARLQLLSDTAEKPLSALGGSTRTQFHSQPNSNQYLLMWAKISIQDICDWSWNILSQLISRNDLVKYPITISFYYFKSINFTNRKTLFCCNVDRTLTQILIYLFFLRDFKCLDENLNIYMCVYWHIHTNICILCTYTDTYICMHVYIHIHTNIYIYVCVCIWIFQAHTLRESLEDLKRFSTRKSLSVWFLFSTVIIFFLITTVAAKLLNLGAAQLGVEGWNW